MSITYSLSPSERSYIITGLTHPTNPTRSDGRSLLAHRPFAISYGDAPQASGSSRVVLDNGTEVVAGIRLEVEDVASAKGKGREGWRTRVSVDVTPQAYPQLSSQAIQTLSTQYAAMISDHFVPSIPDLPILPPTKYFVPYLHLTLTSTSTGSVLPTLIIAARAAFADLRIPKTKRIGWEAGSKPGFEEEGESDLSGIKAAVRAGRTKAGKGKGRTGGDEWDLDMEGSGDGTIPLEGKEELPVLVTLHLLPKAEGFFLDATPQEESACPDKIHMFFNRQQKLCGMRLEGTEGIPAEKVRPLLKEGQRVAAELIASLNAQLPSQ